MEHYMFKCPQKGLFLITKIIHFLDGTYKKSEKIEERELPTETSEQDICNDERFKIINR